MTDLLHFYLLVTYSLTSLPAYPHHRSLLGSPTSVMHQLQDGALYTFHSYVPSAQLCATAH